MSSTIASPVAPVAHTVDLEALRHIKNSDEQAYQVARQFETLLIEEVIKSARSAGSGWLGEDADDTSESVAQMGEQFLAQALASGGGFGLAAQFAPLLARDLQSSAQVPSPMRDGADAPNPPASEFKPTLNLGSTEG